MFSNKENHKLYFQGIPSIGNSLNGTNVRLDKYYNLDVLDL